MYALWHPYAAHHIPFDLQDILQSYITIRKEGNLTTSHLITEFPNTLTSRYHTDHQMALIDCI